MPCLNPKNRDAARATLRVLAAVLSTSLLASVTGCASAVRHRDAGPVVGRGGSSAELVFPGAAVLAAGGSDAYAWPESSRRDLALNARGNDPGYPIDSWPSTPRASLDDARRLNFSSSASSYIYFRSDPGIVYSPNEGSGFWRPW